MASGVKRLIPDLAPYPPKDYMVVYHPDVQLTTEEWLELEEYEKLESVALCDPGVLGFMHKPKMKYHAAGLVVAAAKVHEGR